MSTNTNIILEKLKQLPEPNIPKLISFLREKLGLDPVSLAALLKTTERSVRRWEKGELEPGGTFAAKIVEFKHIVDLSNKNPISLRLSKILSLMQQAQELSRLNIEKMAYLLEMESPTELRNYFEDKSEPTYNFLDNFSATFGVNPNWLKFGEGKPYQDYNSTKDFNPCKTFDDKYEGVVINTVIDQLDPDGIIFVKSKSDVGESVIVFKIKDWKYVVCFNPYHISSHNGHGGIRELLNLYRFIKKIEYSRYERLCSGRVIDDEYFKQLFTGEIFPGEPISKSWPISWWWEDLVDLDYRKRQPEDYQHYYGKGFLEAQELIRRGLEADEIRQRRG